MTPSFSGRMAWMWAGVRPIIRLASRPTASGRPSLTLTATTDGSLSTMPRPRTYTRVLAVPRSTAMSRPMIEENGLSEDMDPPRAERGGDRSVREGSGAYKAPPNPFRRPMLAPVTQLQQSPSSWP